MKAVAIPRDSRSVVLSIPCEGTSAGAPELGGVVYSLVRNSGIPETAFIDLEAEGIPVSFTGDTWRAGWSRIGAKRELRVGFPDLLFSSSFDAPVRIQIDAVSKGTPALRLGTLAIDVMVPVSHENREWPVWAPACAD